MVYFLSIQQYAIYSLSLYWSLVVLVFSIMGMSEHIVKLILNQFSSKSETASPSRLVSIILINSLVAVSLFGFLSIAFVMTFNTGISGGIAFHAQLLMCLAAMLLAYIEIIHAVFRALGIIRIQSIFILVYAICVCLCYPVVAKLSDSAVAVAAAYLLINFLFFFSQLLYCHSLGYVKSNCVSFRMAAKISIQTLPHGMISILVMLFPVIFASLVATISVISLSAQFNLLIAMFLAGNTFAIVLDHVMYPKYVLDNENKSKNTMVHFLISTSIYVSIAVVMYFFGKKIFQLVLPDNFSGILDVLLVLCVAWIVRCWAQTLIVFHRLNNTLNVCIFSYSLICILAVLQYLYKVIPLPTGSLLAHVNIMIILEIIAVIIMACGGMLRGVRNSKLTAF